jgi:hypothetical protein
MFILILRPRRDEVGGPFRILYNKELGDCLMSRGIARIVICKTLR